jgi:hypothetical protein
MIIRQFHLVTLVVVLSSASILTVRGQSNTDPLNPFTACKLPGDLKVKEVRRRNQGNNYRDVVTGNGKEKVSVIDGYRVMFAYSDLPYYFANVKIEQSSPDSWAKDKEILISQLQYQSTPPKTFLMTFADTNLLNGFEHHGIDRDKIDSGDEVGMHVLFYDPLHLVVTVYFLNQSKAVFANNRRFETIKQYRELRDDFLARYSECLKRVADAQH